MVACTICLGVSASAHAGSWDGWFDAFLNGRAPLPGASPPPEAHASDYDGGGDWFAHTRSWWTAAQRFPEQVLWISYESLHADMPAAVRRLGAFLRRSQDGAPPDFASPQAARSAVLQQSSLACKRERDAVKVVPSLLASCLAYCATLVE
eukprot:6184036-Pleurochrysis_carterae.AAC.3